MSETSVDKTQKTDVSASNIELSQKGLSQMFFESNGTASTHTLHYDCETMSDTNLKKRLSWESRGSLKPFICQINDAEAHRRVRILNSKLTHANFNVIDIIGDGNCFFSIIISGSMLPSKQLCVYTPEHRQCI